MKAVAYLRVSTSADDQANGIAAQKHDIGSFAKSRGIDIIAWHADELSGATPCDERPGFLAALGDLPGCTYLIAQKRDRVARDVIVAATFEKLVQNAGATVLTADGSSAADTPEGVLLNQLLDVFAQYERALIRARIKKSFAAMKAAGHKLGPLRYADTRRGAEIVVQIMKLREKRLSYSACARFLNENKVPTQKGVAWTKKGVKNMVQPRVREKSIRELGLHIGPVRQR